MSTMAFVCSICLLWASRNISVDRSNLALSCSILFSHISTKELCMPVWSRTFSASFTQDVEIGEAFFNFLNSIFSSRARTALTLTLDSAAVYSPAVAFFGFRAFWTPFFIRRIDIVPDFYFFLCETPHSLLNLGAHASRNSGVSFSVLSADLTRGFFVLCLP